MNPCNNEDSEESDVNLFHWRNPCDYHCRQRRLEDRGYDLNVKIEILENHGSLHGDDFMEWPEAIKQIF